MHRKWSRSKRWIRRGCRAEHAAGRARAGTWRNLANWRSNLRRGRCAIPRLLRTESIARLRLRGFPGRRESPRRLTPLRALGRGQPPQLRVQLVALPTPGRSPRCRHTHHRLLTCVAGIPGRLSNGSDFARAPGLVEDASRVGCRAKERVPAIARLVTSICPRRHSAARWPSSSPG